MNYNSFVFEGHGISEVTGGYDPGAVTNGHKENDIAGKIVESAKGYLSKTALVIHYDENNYSDNDLYGNTYSSKCGVVVHINAGGGTGVEAFVPCKEKYLDCDFEITKNLSTIMGIPNRGVKSRDYNSERTYQRTNGVALNYTDYYKEIRMAWQMGISLMILEVGFIDSNDINKILDNINKIGYEVANYIAKNCDASLGADDILSSGNINNKFYIVQKGETLWAISRKLGVSIEVLSKKNMLSNPSLIYPGDKLYY